MAPGLRYEGLGEARTVLGYLGFCTKGSVLSPSLSGAARAPVLSSGKSAPELSSSRPAAVPIPASKSTGRSKRAWFTYYVQ